ncbi:MAG: membrane protein insertion efficiency factor YidD [Christensenellales bacterium]|jgi:putative membrane protein insertion efficiency factor
MKKLLLKLIEAYRKHISPMLPAACRFVPSCSQYAYTAIQDYGVFKGLCLALFRLLRCNPFCKGGYDPVPNKDVKQGGK